MMKAGQIFLKIAGRDAGKVCVIVDILDDNYVLIDGETRRKKCNMKHLEPTDKQIDIKKKASHDTVVKEFKKLGIELKETKKKEQKPRPKKIRKHVAKKQAEKSQKDSKKKPQKKEDKKAKKPVSEDKKSENKKKSSTSKKSKSPEK